MQIKKYHNIRDAINTSLVSIMPKILLEYFDAKLPPFRQNKIDRNGAFDINWAEKKLGKWIWYIQEEEHEKIGKRKEHEQDEVKNKNSITFMVWHETWLINYNSMQCLKLFPSK